MGAAASRKTIPLTEKTNSGGEMDRKKAVLFDMDGVLFDSMPNHAYSWSHAVTEFGLSMSPEEAYLHEGRTGSGTIDILAQRHWGRNATEEEKQRIYDAKTRIFLSCPKPKPMPGALQLLETVRDLGLKIVLVTGSATTTLLQQLDRHFPHIFQQDRMVTGFDVKFGKPHPEPYLMGLRKACVEAGEALVVENAPLGVQSAHAAGIFTIAANTGPLPDQLLLDSGADVVLPNLFEVKDLLTSLVK